MAHLHDVIAPRQRFDSMNIHRKNSTNMSIGWHIDQILDELDSMNKKVGLDE